MSVTIYCYATVDRMNTLAIHISKYKEISMWEPRKPFPLPLTRAFHYISSWMIDFYRNKSITQFTFMPFRLCTFQQVVYYKTFIVKLYHCINIHLMVNFGVKGKSAATFYFVSLLTFGCICGWDDPFESCL